MKIKLLLNIVISRKIIILGFIQNNQKKKTTFLRKTPYNKVNSIILYYRGFC